MTSLHCTEICTGETAKSFTVVCALSEIRFFGPVPFWCVPAASGPSHFKVTTTLLN